MFDVFGMSKADTREAIQEMAAGVTRGLIEAFEFKLMEKESEIKRLQEHISDEKTWKARYEELSELIKLKGKDEDIINK